MLSITPRLHARSVPAHARSWLPHALWYTRRAIDTQRRAAIGTARTVRSGIGAGPPACDLPPLPRGLQLADRRQDLLGWRVVDNTTYVVLNATGWPPGHARPSGRPAIPRAGG